MIGQLWQECPRCGAEPVCTECQLCSRECRCSRTGGRSVVDETPLPPLRGTEKQVEWADGIRKRLLDGMERTLTAWAGAIEKAIRLHQSAETIEQARTNWRAAADALEKIRQETRSWVWIDGREETPRQWLKREEYHS